MENLIRKYNVPVPRYTSYPTVPYWESESFSVNTWIEKITEAAAASEESGISLYIHLPYCESLCTYCGCNTRITVNHKVELPYIEALLHEWKMYRNLFSGKPRIKEIHLGGGTPTFFSPENLEILITEILSHSIVDENCEMGFEAHPNFTSEEHLRTLYRIGFRRVSFGIQDFDPEVQKIINREQSFETVAKITNAAREIGYTSINYDLIYGLPLQTKKSIIDTLDKVKFLRPDRIAFYSYAHVPWIKPGQRKFTENDLPLGETKRELYETGRRILNEVGYVEIGMDHFALRNDELNKAMQNHSLHRNFMGYTTTATKLLIGLGVSSISDSWTAFAQNVKVVEEYIKIIGQNEFPVFKGHISNREDLILRQHILNLMCTFETSWYDESEQTEFLYEGLNRLSELEKDGIVEIQPYCIKVTEKGRAFLRNICASLDARLLRKIPTTEIFSSAV